MLTQEDIDLIPANLLIPHYLSASYLYYVKSTQAMTDLQFDYLCSRIEREWGSIKHRHKDLAEKAGVLGAGTCMLKDEDYPSIVRNGADDYLALCSSGEMSRTIRSMVPRRETPPKVPALRRRTPTPVNPTTKAIRRIVGRPITASPEEPTPKATGAGPRRIIRRKNGG